MTTPSHPKGKHFHTLINNLNPLKKLEIMEQTTIPTSFNIIKSIKTVAEKLENSKLDATTLNDIAPQVAKLCICLNAYEPHIQLFCVIYILDFLGADVHINDIVKYLDLNLDQKESVRYQLNEMAQNKLINSKLTTSDKTDSLEQFNVVYKINAKVSAGILNNTVILSNKLDETMSIFQFNTTVRELVDCLSNGLIDLSKLLEVVEKLEKTNAELNAIRQLTDYDLRVIDRIVLYQMCHTLVNQQTGCSLKMLIKSIFLEEKTTDEQCELFVSGNNRLIDQWLIKVTRSEIHDDYYLELGPDTVVMFLVDKPELEVRHISSKLDSNEPYFNVN